MVPEQPTDRRQVNAGPVRGAAWFHRDRLSASLIREPISWESSSAADKEASLFFQVSRVPLFSNSMSLLLCSFLLFPFFIFSLFFFFHSSLYLPCQIFFILFL